MICTKEDDYTFEKPRWVITLSDGTNVYGDDNRPGEEEPSAWKRLKKHVEDNNLKIDKIRLQFRSVNEFPVPDFADGYYVANMAACFAEPGGQLFNCFSVGYVKEDKLHVKKYVALGLIYMDGFDEVRDVNQEGIIWNRKSTS